MTWWEDAWGSVVGSYGPTSIRSRRREDEKMLSIRAAWWVKAAPIVATPHRALEPGGVENGASGGVTLPP
jgi:hypothetical protein